MDMMAEDEPETAADARGGHQSAAGIDPAMGALLQALDAKIGRSGLMQLLSGILQSSGQPQAQPMMPAARPQMPPGGPGMGMMGPQ
jgi:hypothetical protein